MFSRIIFGIGGIALGLAMLRYTRQFKMWTGNIGWAERFIGMGGTYTVLRLLGILLAIIAFLYLTGGLNNLVSSLFGRFFGL